MGMMAVKVQDVFTFESFIFVEEYLETFLENESKVICQS